ncbi:IS5 family transposase [Burkholderia territorii]|uniref:IS5 family transposase n=1 Tax=Burkholderia territorii TaxID=1503055 RepID=UPI001E5A1D3E|nr:IS5 family transposase [Burkholderia territorii]
MLSARPNWTAERSLSGRAVALSGQPITTRRPDVNIHNGERRRRRSLQKSTSRASASSDHKRPSPRLRDGIKKGSKHHIVTDANGTPLAPSLTGANVNDVTQLLPLIDAISPICGLRGHPLQRPRVVYADRGYDSEQHRRAFRDRGIEPVIAKRRTEHGSGLGKYHWVVERTHAWLHHFRRLRICFERRADIHGAFLKLGCCLICWNTLRRADLSL